MKKSQKLTVAMVICLVVLVAGVWLLFGRSIGSTYAYAEKYTAGDTVISSPVEDLEINWTSGSVSVAYHQEDSITVSETAASSLGQNQQLRWWLDGTTLRIQFAESGLRSGLFSIPEKHLTITLPEGMKLKTAMIRATSAKLNIPDLTAEELTLSTTSGDILAAAESEKLTASSTSGSLEFRLRGTMDFAELGSTSGSITAELETAKKITAGTTSGGINLKVSGSADKTVLKSTSGFVSQDISRVKEAEISATSGSIQVRIGDFEKLKIGSTSGNVSAALPDQPGLTCRISTTGGSFSSGIALEKDGKIYRCGDGSREVEINVTSGSITLEKI